MPDCYLFAGPSLTSRARAAGVAHGIRILPPVVRGDITRLVERKTPARLIIADGLFHQAMSVGHAELRVALELGWRVFGVSSLGAIRAFELRAQGMRGYGKVYQMFSRFADFQDDEVALVHGPDPPYRAGSEPLVHLRVALSAFVRDGILERSRAREIVRSLKTLWYGDRTLELFEELAKTEVARADCNYVSEAVRSFDRFRIKQQDLESFLIRNRWNGSRTRSRARAAS
jgi:hypothetical protein